MTDTLAAIKSVAGPRNGPWARIVPDHPLLIFAYYPFAADFHRIHEGLPCAGE